MIKYGKNNKKRSQKKPFLSFFFVFVTLYGKKVTTVKDLELKPVEKITEYRDPSNEAFFKTFCCRHLGRTCCVIGFLAPTFGFLGGAFLTIVNEYQKSFNHGNTTNITLTEIVKYQ